MPHLTPLFIIGCASPDTQPWPGCPLYLSPVSAGWPSPADDYIEEEINLHDVAARNPTAPFFLRAAGDSMIGVGIHDEDLLEVDRSIPAGHNRIVIAAIDGELLFKKDDPLRLPGLQESGLGNETGTPVARLDNLPAGAFEGVRSGRGVRV